MAAASRSAPAPPPDGDLRDVGATRRASVGARAYTSLGETKVLGDLVAATVDLHGRATIGGRLTAERVRAQATLDVAGEVTARAEFSVRGSARLGEGLLTGDLTVQGHLVVARGIAVEGHARVRGRIEAGAGMSVRSLQLDGGVVVPGLFDCPTGVVHLRSPSRIGTLRSENLRIVPPLFPPARRLLLVVDRIEAKDVEIAGVDCEYLRADRVRLGPHAHVTRLDGEVIRRHPTAVVGPWAREPIPPGLSR